MLGRGADSPLAAPGGCRAAGAFMTFLTTQSGLVGDLARMSGYGVVSGVKAIGSLERRFEVRRFKI